MYRHENTVTLLDFIESVFDTGVDLYSFIHNKLEKKLWFTVWSSAEAF